MPTSLPRFGVPLLFVLLPALTACDGMYVAVTEPAAFPASTVHGSLGVQPLNVQPEFFHAGSCGGYPPFGARLSFVVNSGQDVILRSVRIHYIDRFGGKFFPDVMPIPSLSTPVPTIPAASPVSVPGFAPLTGATTITIAGHSPFTGLYVRAGTHFALPYYMRFGCGVYSHGTIVILIDFGDRNGAFTNSELRVRVG